MPSTGSISTFMPTTEILDRLGERARTPRVDVLKTATDPLAGLGTIDDLEEGPGTPWRPGRRARRDG
jgi:hypothetical protein